MATIHIFWGAVPRLVAAFLGAASILLRLSSSLAEGARQLPAAALDESDRKATSGVAVFASGCFLGMQGVFKHVEGVANAISGCAGGEAATSHYQRVSIGDTGHAESARVSYNPRKISYGRLLQIYFSVAHDPTEMNRQGPDSGARYRSAIFPTNAEQAKVARAYIAQLNEAHVFKGAVVTRIEPDRTFFSAEAYHQDFLMQNPTNPYIVINDLPKVRSLKLFFPEIYRAKPVLVGTVGSSS